MNIEMKVRAVDRYEREGKPPQPIVERKKLIKV